MRILSEETIGLIIDFQERLFPHIAENESIEKKTITLIKGLKYLAVPLIVTQQYTKALGETIPAIAASVGTFAPVEKLAFSCCDEPAFVDKLKKTGKSKLIIAGIEAHICVTQTVIDLVASGFQPIVVVDCVSSRNLQDKKIALSRMKQEGALLTTCEAILFELTRFSRTETFKSISKLVK